jgi:hypothetical protein
MTEAALLSVRGLEVAMPPTGSGPGSGRHQPRYSAKGGVVGIVGERRRPSTALALMGLLPANASSPQDPALRRRWLALSRLAPAPFAGTKMAMVFRIMSALRFFAIGTQMVDIQRAEPAAKRRALAARHRHADPRGRPRCALADEPLSP